MTLVAYQSNPTHAQEAGLIGRIVDGKKELFSELIMPHLTSLTRAVRAAVGGHPDMQDIVQQSVLKALTHLGQFRLQASFGTWLLTIGLNEARQWRRKAATSRVVTVDTAVLAQLGAADKRNCPLVECQRAETERRVKAALDALPEKYRSVFLLYNLEGLSLLEISRRLGLSLPAAKSRHLRARLMLARSLGRAYESLRNVH